jgi:membrane associated rhomboid family serine protease
MKEHRVTWGGENVDVDLCNDCRGLWLDAREGQRLRRILLRAEQDRAHSLAAERPPPGLGAYLFQLFTGMPLEVWNPVRTRPVLVWGLLAVLIAVAIFEVAWIFLGGPQAGGAMMRTLGLIPGDLLAGRRLTTLFTHAFVHAGFLHLLGNLYFLYVFGDNIEDTLGKKRFAAIYGAAAMTGALMHVLTHPQSTTPMVGASGAIAGLMGAYLVLFPRVKVWLVFFFVRFRLGVFAYLAVWILAQIALARSGQSRVAAMAHLGGFAAGVVLGFAFKRRGLPWENKPTVDHPIRP